MPKDANSPRNVKLELPPNELPALQQTFQWKGIAVDHTRLGPVTEYDFKWSGDRHYIASHDLVLADGEMTVDDVGTIRGGDLRDKLTYLPPGCSVEGWSKNVSRRNTFTTLSFDVEVLAQEMGRPITDPHGPPHIYFENLSLRSTMMKLENLMNDIAFEGGGIYAETLALLVVLELGTLADSGVLGAGRLGKLTSYQESRVRDFIDGNIGQSFSLSDLADVAGQSRFHFSRSFKSTFGQSPHRFITARRMSEAKVLLATSNLPVTDIASRVGYASLGQFIRAFKALELVTPGEYRSRL